MILPLLVILLVLVLVLPFTALRRALHGEALLHCE